MNPPDRKALTAYASAIWQGDNQFHRCNGCSTLKRGRARRGEIYSLEQSTAFAAIPCEKCGEVSFTRIYRGRDVQAIARREVDQLVETMFQADQQIYEEWCKRHDTTNIDAAALRKKNRVAAWIIGLAMLAFATVFTAIHPAIALMFLLAAFFVPFYMTKD